MASKSTPKVSDGLTPEELAEAQKLSTQWKHLDKFHQIRDGRTYKAGPLVKAKYGTHRNCMGQPCGNHRVYTLVDGPAVTIGLDDVSDGDMRFWTEEDEQRGKPYGKTLIVSNGQHKAWNRMGKLFGWPERAN